jgi:hypothetical protein
MRDFRLIDVPGAWPRFSNQTQYPPFTLSDLPHLRFQRRIEVFCRRTVLVGMLPLSCRSMGDPNHGREFSI